MDEPKLNLQGYTVSKLGKFTWKPQKRCKSEKWPILYIIVGRGTQGSVFKAYTKSSPKTAVAIKVRF